MRENSAVLTLTLDFGEIFDVFHVFFVRFRIPEDDAELHSVCLLIGKNQSSV